MSHVSFQPRNNSDVASAALEFHIRYTGLGAACSQASIILLETEHRWRCCQADGKMWPSLCSRGGMERPARCPCHSRAAPSITGEVVEVQCGNSVLGKVLSGVWKQMSVFWDPPRVPLPLPVHQRLHREPRPPQCDLSGGESRKIQ